LQVAPKGEKTVKGKGGKGLIRGSMFRVGGRRRTGHRECYIAKGERMPARKKTWGQIGGGAGYPREESRSPWSFYQDPGIANKSIGRGRVWDL